MVARYAPDSDRSLSASTKSFLSARLAAGSDQSAALARVWEKTAKVALIKAVSANLEAPVIRGEDAIWARDVVAHCVATLLVQAERHLANNEHEANHKKVLRLPSTNARRRLKQSRHRWVAQSCGAGL